MPERAGCGGVGSRSIDSNYVGSRRIGPCLIGSRLIGPDFVDPAFVRPRLSGSRLMGPGLIRTGRVESRLADPDIPKPAASTRDVVLVDGGGTNIGSVRYALERLGIAAQLSADAARIRRATHVILPGVGAAPPGMAKLRAAGLVEVLRELRQPLLGVCLGMQLLYEHSEEGDTECLGLLPGSVRHFPQSDDLRVPHMGWNRLEVERDDALCAGIGAEPYAYFVHSYAAPMSPATLASAEYGGRFSAVVRRDNICGMQFHPERSAALGARLLANFLGL